MISIPKERGAIASWWFEDRSQNVSPKDSDTLKILLSMCQKVVNVLSSYQLLTVETTTFSGWLSYNTNTKSFEKVEKENVVIKLGKYRSHSNLVDLCEKVLTQSRPYPMGIEICGTGEILDGSGQKKEFDNVVWLLAKTLDANIVDIRTQNDAWLPYSLKAERQEQIYNLNAPRLEKALIEIEESLGIKPTYNDFSDYAKINGYQLANIVDVDGELIKVY